MRVSCSFERIVLMPWRNESIELKAIQRLEQHVTWCVIVPCDGRFDALYSGKGSLKSSRSKHSAGGTFVVR